MDTYPNVRAQGQLHSIDDMIVTDLARTYPTATGREVQRAMVEGSPHLHERKADHEDDYPTRHRRNPRPVHRADRSRSWADRRVATRSL